MDEIPCSGTVEEEHSGSYYHGKLIALSEVSWLQKSHCKHNCSSITRLERQELKIFVSMKDSTGPCRINCRIVLTVCNDSVQSHEPSVHSVLGVTGAGPSTPLVSQ